MIRKEILERFFNVASMQRWNDHVRPLDFSELDKQGHKMILAYLFSKFEENGRNSNFDWSKIIEGAIFEMLQRTVITDLKPQLFYRIKRDSEKYRELNRWIYGQIREELESVDKSFANGFESYFMEESADINRRILSAAHFYSTKWEYDVIEPFNHAGLAMRQTKEELLRRQEQFNDIEGFRMVMLTSGLKNFVDLCGQLRFQQRWSHMYRVPRTSVLGHLCLVAVFSYLFSLKIGACPRRARNNFFCGLFHDLPEALTRDIVAPVKTAVEGLFDLIREYEEEEMQEKVISNIPKTWVCEMESFTKFEFKSMTGTSSSRKLRTSEKISNTYNLDKFDPMDGELVRFSDHLTAFMEAYLSVENGIRNKEFKNAAANLYRKYRGWSISGKKLGKIYEQFEL